MLALKFIVRPATIAVALAAPICVAAQDAPSSEERPKADKPLLVPQIEGERQGRLAGRAIACGAARERIDTALRAARARMIAAVGAAFTEDRYLPALGRALEFEVSLGRPSDEACAKGIDAFAWFEASP